MKEGNAQQTKYVCQLPVQKFKIVKEEEEGKFAQILFQKGELKFFQPTNKGESNRSHMIRNDFKGGLTIV